MSDLMNALLAHGSEILLGLIVFLAGAALRRLKAYADVREQATKDGTAADIGLKALAIVAQCAQDAVATVEATLRPLVKEFTADGKITAEEGAMLRKEAIRIATAQARAAAPKLIGLVSLDTLVATAVDSWAAKLAGTSRKTMAREWEQPTANP